MDIKSALPGCQCVPGSQCTGINGGSEAGGGRGAKPAYSLSQNSPECETTTPHRHQHLFCFCSKLKSPYPEIPLSPALYNQILPVPQRIDQLLFPSHSSMPSPFTQIRNTVYLSLHGKQMGKQWKQCQTLFLGAPKSLQMVIAVMKLQDVYSLEGKLRPTQIAYSKAEILLCQQRSIQSRLWFFQQSCMDVRVGL